MKLDNDNINNLLLNSDCGTMFNNLSNEYEIESINGGLILINIIPKDSFGGNFILFKKCLSKVNKTLFSSLDNSNI